MKYIFKSILSLSFVITTVMLCGQSQNYSLCPSLVPGEGTAQIIPTDPIDIVDPLPFDPKPVFPTGHPSNPNTQSSNGSGNSGSSSFSDEKLISFIHGLTGTDDTWELVAAHIESAYKVREERPEYDQPNWSTAENELFEDAREGTLHEVTTHNLDPKSSIAICHSLGGLMSRQVQRRMLQESIADNENTFQGIITIGSPLAGAEIANNVDRVQDWSYDGIKNMANAFGYEFLQSSPLGNPIVEGLLNQILSVQLDHPFETLELILSMQLDSDIQLYDNFFVHVFQEALSIFDPGILQEIAPQAPNVQSLNAYQNSMPSVAVYAIEDDPVLLRYLSSRMYNQNLGVFEDNDDQRLVDEVNGFHALLSDKTEEYLNAYLNYSYACTPAQFAMDPGGCNFSFLTDWLFENWNEENLFTAYDNYKKARNWIGNMDRSWKFIIGSLEVQNTFLGYECLCNEIADGDVVNTTVEIVSNALECDMLGNGDNMDCTYSASEVYEIQVVEISPSDSVVPVYSQVAFPNVGMIDFMPGNNHQQQRNSNGTKAVFNKMESEYYGDHFKIDFL